MECITHYTTRIIELSTRTNMLENTKLVWHDLWIERSQQLRRIRGIINEEDSDTVDQFDRIRTIIAEEIR
jgi:hypothetical protein